MAKGYDEKVVDDCLRRVRIAEYKRRQAAPVIKITKKAFGIGWKMPIVNRLPVEQRTIAENQPYFILCLRFLPSYKEIRTVLAS